MSEHEADCPFIKIAPVLMRLHRDLAASQKRIRELEHEIEARDNYRPAKRPNILQPRPIHLAYVSQHVPSVQYLQNPLLHPIPRISLDHDPSEVMTFDLSPPPPPINPYRPSIRQIHNNNINNNTSNWDIF